MASSVQPLGPWAVALIRLWSNPDLLTRFFPFYPPCPSLCSCASGAPPLGLRLGSQDDQERDNSASHIQMSLCVCQQNGLIFTKQNWLHPERLFVSNGAFQWHLLQYWLPLTCNHSFPGLCLQMEQLFLSSWLRVPPRRSEPSGPHSEQKQSFLLSPLSNRYHPWHWRGIIGTAALCFYQWNTTHACFTKDGWGRESISTSRGTEGKESPLDSIDCDLSSFEPFPCEDPHSHPLIIGKFKQFLPCLTPFLRAQSGVQV